MKPTHVCGGFNRKLARIKMGVRIQHVTTFLLCAAVLYLTLSLVAERQEKRSLDEQLGAAQLKLTQFEESVNPIRAGLVPKPRPHRPDIPVIVAITPTFTRPTQKADLTRLSLTLRHVPNFHWILVEDSMTKTAKVTRFLSTCGLHYTHLNTRTPEDMQLVSREPRWHKHRGVEQRNLGLSYILEHADEFLPESQNAIVYFMDDDNTYSLELFDDMRFIKKVGVWPVGLVGGLLWEGPVCNSEGVIGFHSLWRTDRFFPMDMAGFAVNLRTLREHSEARLDPSVHFGFLESTFLSLLLSNRRDLMEPRADLCRKILVWHTRTEKANMKREKELNAKGQQSDPALDV
ncbi:galactosylgalactosylxylosylprotein 3-beta-glucuronosyltransferase 3-like [Sycon ciliatum]|uniref:galactosylgalactosylxylosylprotein 3-beta-glucuronosyltransferase 3-like n=1 Tax=Sycon ciliatum TaxID=27933 RepID=UPI0031F62EC3|eukprot:scpid33216/ scgid11109/ Galactosylgalactosylxylosylprotein 3-beta-glucuronosyltransferase 3; Beta-1,3-glucuronyltransferase 3; Glucuronosyltransferase I; UDP-GlcUA:Gal beta-1,3-Gal-R glucuronyltransferase